MGPGKKGTNILCLYFKGINVFQVLVKDSPRLLNVWEYGRHINIAKMQFTFFNLIKKGERKGFLLVKQCPLPLPKDSFLNVKSIAESSMLCDLVLRRGPLSFLCWCLLALILFSQQLANLACIFDWTFLLVKTTPLNPCCCLIILCWAPLLHLLAFCHPNLKDLVLLFIWVFWHCCLVLFLFSASSRQLLGFSPYRLLNFSFKF